MVGITRAMINFLFTLAIILQILAWDDNTGKVLPWWFWLSVFIAFLVYNYKDE